MSRWIVGTVPSWLVLLALILIVSGGAVLLCAFLRKRIPGLANVEHNDALKFGYGVIGFVYAFFIGFVVSGMWGQIADADTDAAAEGSAGLQLARDSSTFGPNLGATIRQSLLAYERSAEAEWPSAARGQSLPQTDAALAQLSQAYRDVRPGNSAEKAFLKISVANLDKLSQARTQRILSGQGDSGPTGPLWSVIFLTSGLVLGCAIAFGVENPRMHYPMVAIVGALVAANLFLVLELSHPYLGDVGTSPDSLRMVIAELD